MGLPSFLWSGHLEAQRVIDIAGWLFSLLFAAQHQPATSRFRQKSWAAVGLADHGTARTLAVPSLFLTVPVQTKTIERCLWRQNFGRCDTYSTACVRRASPAIQRSGSDATFQSSALVCVGWVP
jgi:hypothetical protein